MSQWQTQERNANVSLGFSSVLEPAISLQSRRIRRGIVKQQRSYLELASEVIAVGGLLYLLDPDRYGRRRRVLLRDKAIRAEHVTTQFADKAMRDLRNRLRGILAESR